MDELFLIDVSGYIFRAYFALPPMTNPEGKATHALYGFIRAMLKLIKDFKPTHMAAIFDGPRSKESRIAIYEKYKGTRKPIPEDLPHQIELAKEFCKLFGIAEVTLEGVEADDAMGSIAHQMSKKGAKIYLCTSDKDLCQFVGNGIYLLQTHKNNLLIDEKKVEETFGVRPDQIVDLLAMMGDASDNIPGLPGFGAKTAAKLLQEFGTLDEILANPDKVAGKKKQETLRNETEVAKLSQELAYIPSNLQVPTAENFYTLKERNQEALRDFYHQMNFSSLLKEGAKKTPQKANEKYHIVDDPKSFAALLSRLKSATEICFDTETTAVRPLQAELVGIGFGIKEGEAWYVPANGKLGLEALLGGVRPLFEDPKHLFYGHNVKYDMHVLSNYGIEVATINFDTMVASYVLNSHSRRHSLDALALEYFDKVKTPIKDLIGTGKKQVSMMDVSIEKVGPYCCEDVDYTCRLKSILEKELHKHKALEKVYSEMELLLVPVLARIERNGIYVDPKKLRSLAHTFGVESEKLRKEIHQLAGEEFQINSPKQLSHILFEKMGISPPKKTATGFSTDASVLEMLAPDYPIAGKVLRYRSFEKLRSTYVETLPDEIDPKTDRIHCTFNQGVTATGRLSCSDPNLQNIPVRSPEGMKIREAFRPQESGWEFLSADYSQIELRLVAHLSDDPHLVSAFQQGEDVHAFTASLIFEVPLDQVTKEQRHQAKAVNFGIIYGQQAFGLARELGTSVKDAALFIRAYFDRFDKVEKFIAQCKQKAAKSGKAVTMMGRERVLPDIASRNAAARNAAERLAINTPLQGSSADLIKIAMLKIDKELIRRDLRTKMVLQIHDELIFEVPKKELPEVKELVKSTMEGAFQLKVPLVVDLSVGSNWKEC